MSFEQFRRLQNNVWVHTLNFTVVQMFYATASCFVVHRSLPHALEWLNLTKFLLDIEAQGFEPRLITPMRNKHIVAMSQLREAHVLTIEEAYVNIAKATKIIARAVSDLPRLWYKSVIYSDLAHPQAMRWFFERDLGVRVPHVLPVFIDEDDKYYNNLTIATNQYALRRARTKAKVDALRAKKLPSK